uniref:Laminin EGF-like domain-containing protein n=1 Tax=Panagrellus redivivus TaxID=6233 RepID=A0A7E4VBF7_PANRE
MNLFLVFLFISGACAATYSVFDHLEPPKLVPDIDCPPLYYGENCTVPYCYPEHGLLVQRSADDFFCNCTARYTSGAHCEIVDCNYGIRSNSTLQCECPDYVYGTHCEETIEMYLLLLVMTCCALGILFLLWRTKDKSRGTPAVPSTNNQSSTPPAPAPAPAPEIRIVERVVIQERSDAPPTYDDAMDSADPPKYSEKK